MAIVQIIFKHAALDELFANAKTLGKPLPDDYLGPTFDNAEVGAVMNGSMIGVHPDGEDSYIYNVQDISRIKITNKTETMTESGIVVIKPSIVVPR